MGASVAAGVAAVSILWLRTQAPEPELVANSSGSQSIVLQPEAPAAPAPVVVAQNDSGASTNDEPDRIYSTPAPSSQTSIAPPARFANYVVAHSEYSGPLARRMALMGILGTEAVAEDVEAAAPASPAQKSEQKSDQNSANAGGR
jgi:hypothetical protein